MKKKLILIRKPKKKMTLTKKKAPTPSKRGYSKYA